MSNNKLVEKNMLLNVLKTFISIIFPLITYPYITRVLQVDNFGKINYANSIISYIALIAALGISSYAIREGGIYRSKKENMKKFASEVFSINIYTTIFAYFCLFILILISVKSKDMKLLLLIQSISILSTTIGIDWMNVIYEDYIYITIRSFIAQVISLILLFIFVKTTEDYYIYALIQMFSNVIIAIANWFHIRKQCKICFTTKCNIKIHIKSIMILFSNSLAVSIYLNSDNIMIGLMLSEYFVGLYAISVRIYTILKQLVAAIYSVAVTRMSEYIHQKKINEFKTLLNTIINNIVFISIPMTVGLMCISKSLVYIIAGNTYLRAATSLQILSIAILFAVLGGMIAYCINLPLKREKINLTATTISAVENIILNVFFIKIMGINGAALSTLLSELTVFIILLIDIKDYYNMIDFRVILKNIFKCLISSCVIVFISLLLKNLFPYNSFYYIILTFLLSSISYFVINYILKNQVLFEFFKIRKNDLRKEVL